MRAIKIILQILFLVAIVNASEAATYYATVNGSGTKDGLSLSNAWYGIQWNNLNPGDTVYLSGTFGSISASKNGSSGKPIKIAKEPNSAAVIQGTVDLSNKQYITIEGIEIIGNIFAQGSGYITVQNCYLHDSPAACFDGNYPNPGGHVIQNNTFGKNNQLEAVVLHLTGDYKAQFTRSYVLNNVLQDNGTMKDGITPGNDVTIRGNVISGITSMAKHGDAIPIQGSRVVVDRNYVSSATQGIYADSFDYGPGSICICDDVTISNNLVIQNPSIMPHMNAINLDAGENGGISSMQRCKVYNNTVIGIDQYGINASDRGNGGSRLSGLDIRNNIVIDCGTYTSTGNISVQGAGGIPNLIIDNNLCGQYNNPRPNWRYQGTDYTLSQMQSLGFETHGKENPSLSDLFVNYAYQQVNNYNLHLKSAAAAIGMGVDLGSSYATDYGGTIRTAPWDAGCYSAASQGGGILPAQKAKIKRPANLRGVNS